MERGTHEAEDLPTSARAAQEIRSVLDTLALATDAGDWVGFRECFVDGATADYGDLGRGAIDGIVDAIRESQSRYLGTMNFVGTHHARSDGNGFVAETYVISHHFRRDGGTSWDDHVGTHYVDRFVRGDAGWKIAHRVTRVVWFRQDEVTGAGWL